MTSILIIDDDPAIRTMFARTLSKLGDVETAQNGADALRMLGAKPYSVILLDLHMPVIDGFVLLETLSRKEGPNHDTPIYVVTADNSEQARLRALRRHALFFLTKPVPLGTLVSLVDSTLKKAEARAAAAGAAGADRDPAASPLDAGRRTPPVRPTSTPSGPKKPGS